MKVDLVAQPVRAWRRGRGVYALNAVMVIFHAFAECCAVVVCPPRVLPCCACSATRWRAPAAREKKRARVLVQPGLLLVIELSHDVQAFEFAAAGVVTSRHMARMRTINVRRPLPRADPRKALS